MTKVIIEQAAKSSTMAGFRLTPYAESRLFANRQNRSSIAPLGPISYSIGECRYGSLLVAQTDKGICAILLDDTGNDKTIMQRDLVRRFPKRKLIESAEARGQMELNAVRQCLDDPTLLPSIELDLQGSAFQLSVWKALLQVPLGTTETYTQLAQRANLPPSSARAVANACGQNHIAFLVPCHRIIRNDGQMGGYRWGLRIKEKMLKFEKINGQS